MTATARMPRTHGHTDHAAELERRHRAGLHDRTGARDCPLCIERRQRRGFASLSAAVKRPPADELLVACDCGRELRPFPKTAVWSGDCAWGCGRTDCLTA